MRALPILAVLAACTPPLTEADQDIIGGTRATGSSATVLLAGYPPDRSVLTTCSAVLVSPTVLLTSAHCIDAANHPSYQFGIFTGDDASAYSTLALLEPHLLPVASVHPHPQYQTAVPFYADLGAVVLAQPVTAISPLPMRRQSLDTSLVGAQATIVGYGQTTYQQPNQTRYEAVTMVAGIDGDTVIVGDAQKHGCLGDSGGPAIVGGVVIGVDSYGPVGCGTAAHYRRTDMFLPFLDQYVPPPAAPDAGPSGGGGGPDAGTDDHGAGGGGCNTGRGGSLAVGLALLALLRRRR